MTNGRVLSPLIPPAGRSGGRRRTDIRAVMNGVMYILSTGCQWRYVFPQRSALHDYLTWWICDGTRDRIHHAPYVECREKAEREASPTACIIDSQSVKSAEKGAQERDRPSQRHHIALEQFSLGLNRGGFPQHRCIPDKSPLHFAGAPVAKICERNNEMVGLFAATATTSGCFQVGMALCGESALNLYEEAI
jgi:transposase